MKLLEWCQPMVLDFSLEGELLKLTGQDRGRWMPAGIPDTGPPCHLTTSHLIRRGVHISILWPRLERDATDIDDPSHRGIQIVDMHFTILTARVDIARIGASRWREMAADQGLEHTMSAERHHGAVMRMWLVIFFRVRHETVVETVRVGIDIDLVKILRGHHLPQIPQLHHLILAVRQYITTIALAVNVRETFRVADETTGLSTIPHGPSIPHSDGGIIGPGVQNVWRHGVPETDRVHVVFMILEVQY